MVKNRAIGEKDVTDDRLARVLEEFGLQEEACQEIGQKVGRHMIPAYELANLAKNGQGDRSQTCCLFS